VAAYAGLAPSPFASGDGCHEQGIGKAGNPRVRRMMVELAWLWARLQPETELSRWLTAPVGAAKGRVRRIAIVAPARKLLITAWTILRGAAWATTVIRSGVDAKDDPHLIIVDLDPPDQGADEIAPGGPVRRRQPVPDHPGEALEPTDDQLQRSRPGGGIPQRGGLGLELARALP
jgi:transposase